MLTKEVYTVLEEMDRLLNNAFYQVSQLRALGKLVTHAECSGISDFSAGGFIDDYCVPAFDDLESLQQFLCTLKSYLEVQP
jgi:hypothetical protein